MGQAFKNEEYTDYPSKTILDFLLKIVWVSYRYRFLKNTTNASPKFLPPNFPADLQNPYLTDCNI